MDKKKEKEEFKPYFQGLSPAMDKAEIYWWGEKAIVPESSEQDKDFKFWMMSDRDIENARGKVERFMNDPKNFKWLAERVGAWPEHIARYQKWLAEQKASGR